jgi:predicted Zn-dependent peptidase
VKKIVLQNGLRLLLVPQASSLASSVLILVEAGSEYETKRINGVSHFLEHLTFKGTAQRPKAGMIAEELAALGARSNAFTSQEYTGYWAKAEAKKVHKIVEIVSDLYLNPIFDAGEIEKERGVIIQEINMYEDDLPARVQKNLAALVYGDQPAGWDIGGQKAVIRKLKREDFIAYRTSRYVAKGTVVVISGKFNEAAVTRQVKQYFGALPKRSAPGKIKTKEAQKAPRLNVHFKESDQAHLALAFRAFNLFDKRRYAIQILADVLGGGMSSRLFKRVREELGAAYYVGADADLALDHGLFGVSAGVDHTRIELVLRTIIEECRRIRNDEVPEKELQRSKDHMIGSIILGLETSDQMGSYYGGQEILTGRTLSPALLIDRIKKVTAAEVRAVARDVIKERSLNLAIVGPYKKQEVFKKLLIL